MIKIVDKLLRAGEGRRLKTLEEQAAEITALEPEIGAPDRRASCAPRPTSSGSGSRTARRSTTCCSEAFAVVREAAKRALGMRPFDVQVMGGIVLHEGDIAEMKTGEGKTLVATMPMYLNALAGKGAHLVTVNDYLAKRDAEWMGAGLRVPRPRASASSRTMMTPAERREAVRRRRHLRHQLRVRLRLPARQHGHAPRALRPARPPLLHRRRGRLHPHRRGAHAADHLRRAGDGRRDLPPVRARRAAAACPGEDYEVDEKQRTVAVTESGVAKVERALGIDNLYKRLQRRSSSTTSSRRCAPRRSTTRTSSTWSRTAR